MTIRHAGQTRMGKNVDLRALVSLTKSLWKKFACVQSDTKLKAKNVSVGHFVNVIVLQQIWHFTFGF